MENLKTTLTAAALTQQAAALDHPELTFEYFATTHEPAYRHDALTGESEREIVRQTEYVAYGPSYGVFAVVSSSPEILSHGFVVVFAADASDTNGVAYETLSEALRYMERLEQEQEQEQE